MTRMIYSKRPKVCIYHVHILVSTFSQGLFSMVWVRPFSYNQGRSTLLILLGQIFFTPCYIFSLQKHTHRPEIHTCRDIRVMGLPHTVVRRPQQLGVLCLAQGYLSIQEVNWHLSSYQSTLCIDWFVLDLNLFPSQVPMD